MMQHDDFDHFIRDHRDEFDELMPGQHVWNHIEQRIQFVQPQTVKLISMARKYLLKVAVVLLLVMNASLLLRLTKIQQQPGLAGINPELWQVHLYYATQIENKLQQIRLQQLENIGLPPSVLKELQLQSDAYNQLLQELKANPGNQRIQSALIQYYRLKLALLNKIIEEELHHAPSFPQKHRTNDPTSSI